MKIYIEIPNNFIVDTYLDHADVRRVYKNIVAVAADSRLEVVLKKPNSYLETGDQGPEDGIFYAYHSVNSGKNVYCVKASALPGRWYFDSRGYSGWSSLALDPAMQERSAEFDLSEAEQAISVFRARFNQDNLSRLQQPQGGLEPEISDLGDFVFYPLQVNSDEVLKLGRFAQFEVIGKLGELALKHKRHIILKRHPLCDSEIVERLLEELAGHPFVHVSSASVHQLISACRVVLVSNSGVGVEALIHGKTVFSLARSEYAHMTNRLTSLDELETALLHQPMEQTEKTRRQLGYLIESFWVDVTREDRIARRVQDHIGAFATARPASDDPDPPAARDVSVANRARKELADIIDMLLASYRTLSDGQKDKVAPLLAKVANGGLKSEQIFRNTDTRVWRRSMHYSRVHGDLETAEMLARKVIVQRPDDSEAQLLLSRVLSAKGLDDQSLAAARAAAECPEPMPEALAYYGRRILAASKTNSALAVSYADRALASKPDMAVAHFLKAKALLTGGHVARALESSTTAIGLAPDHPQYVDLHKLIVRKMKKPEPPPESRSASG